MFLTGRTSEAIEEYKQALGINPDYDHAHNNLGNALVQTGRASEAIDHYRQALRMNPNSASAHNGLGAALAQMGRISEAIEELKVALRIKPYRYRYPKQSDKVGGAAENRSGKDRFVEALKSNSGILPDASIRLRSLLTRVRARCPLDITAMMAVLRHCSSGAIRARSSGNSGLALRRRASCRAPCS